MSRSTSSSDSLVNQIAATNIPIRTATPIPIRAAVPMPDCSSSTLFDAEDSVVSFLV